MKLVYEQVEDVGLEDLLRDDIGRAELDGAMAIVSTPDRCLVGRVEGGVCRSPSEEALPIADAFEARVFTAGRNCPKTANLQFDSGARLALRSGFAPRITR